MIVNGSDIMSQEVNMKVIIEIERDEEIEKLKKAFKGENNYCCQGREEQKQDTEAIYKSIM